MREICLRYTIFSVLLYGTGADLSLRSQVAQEVLLASRLVVLVCLSSLLCVRVVGSYCSLCARLFLISLRSYRLFSFVLIRSVDL